MNDLLNLHIKNKYYIDVSKKINGCIVKTPSNIYHDPQYLSEITDYTINDNILTVNNDDFVVPNYAIRILILSDIFMKMSKLGIPPELLVFFDKVQPKKAFSEIIDPPFSEEDKKRDAHMFENIGKIIIGEYDKNDATKNNVLTGFNLIYDVFAKGGI